MRRAAFFFVEGHLSVQPSVLSAAIKMAQHGYSVDLFYVQSDHWFPIPDLPPTIHLVKYVPKNPKLGNLIRRLRSKFRRFNHASNGGSDSDSISARSEKFLSSIQSLARHSLAKIKLLKYYYYHIVRFGLFCRKRARKVDVAIAFDMTGLAAMSIAVAMEVPFIYWSLEITVRSEIRDLATAVLKKLEIRRLPTARAIVVQGWQRADLLARDSTFNRNQVAIVPNGPASQRDENLPTDFFVRRLGIAPTSTIVLHAGMIDPAVCSLEIAAAAASWPDGFVLVFHERRKTDPYHPYIREIESAGRGRVFLSLDPVSFDVVDQIYAGGHIGLICYAPIDLNFATTLVSSGKLTYCLRNGIPVVIVAKCPPRFLLDWRCGICVSQIDEIGDALVTLSCNYSEFSAEARRCYDQIFDFAGGFDQLIRIAML
jgi:hypothetical protein